MRKVFCLILALAMVLTFMPMGIYADETEPFAAPTGLRWITSPTTVNDEDAIPGSVYWEDAVNSCERYKLTIYKADGEIVEETTWHVKADQTVFCKGNFVTLDPPSGTYWFTIQAIDENNPSRNSEVVSSGKWTYTKPSAKLQSPHNLKLTGTVVSWDKVDGHGVEMEYRYSEEKDGDYDYYSNTFTESSWNNQDIIYDISDPGYYRIRVRILSNDITKISSSDWSDWVEYYYPGKEKKTHSMSSKKNAGAKVDLSCDVGSNMIDVQGDISKDAPLLLASFGSDGRFMGLDVVTSNDTVTLGSNTASAKAIWIDSVATPQSEAVEFDLGE